MWWTPDRQQLALEYLVTNAGLSLVGAAGLVSRWMNVESPGGPTSVNPSSGAFGIAQWLGARLPPIRGNTDFESQLAYVVQELNGSEHRAGDVLRSAFDANTAAVGASMYERAEGYNPATGIDNWTNRTAAGVALILSTTTAVVQNGLPVDDSYNDGQLFPNAPSFSDVNYSVSPFDPSALSENHLLILAVLAAGVVLFVVLTGD